MIYRQGRSCDDEDSKDMLIMSGDSELNFEIWMVIVFSIMWDYLGVVGGGDGKQS